MSLKYRLDLYIEISLNSIMISPGKIAIESIYTKRPKTMDMDEG